MYGINGSILVWICVLTFFPLPSVLSRNTYINYLAKGDSAYAAFDNETALANYEKAYQLNGSSYEASWKLSRAHIDLAGVVDSKKQRR